MLTKRLRTGFDIYNIQSEHVVYRTYSQQPINSFLPILKVMCGMNPKTPANFTRGLFNKGENNTLLLQGRQNLKRCEILDFFDQKYRIYPWSLRTLCRRLKYFAIDFIDYDTELDSIEEAVYTWKWMALGDCKAIVPYTKSYERCMV
jgi:hypothetical protein